MQELFSICSSTYKILKVICNIIKVIHRDMVLVVIVSEFLRQLEKQWVSKGFEALLGVRIYFFLLNIILPICQHAFIVIFNLIWICADTITLTLLHSERPKLYAILAFLSAIGLNTNVSFTFLSLSVDQYFFLKLR